MALPFRFKGILVIDTAVTVVVIVNTNTVNGKFINTALTVFVFVMLTKSKCLSMSVFVNFTCIWPKLSEGNL